MVLFEQLILTLIELNRCNHKKPDHSPYTLHRKLNGSPRVFVDRAVQQTVNSLNGTVLSRLIAGAKMCKAPALNYCEKTAIQNAPSQTKKRTYGI